MELKPSFYFNPDFAKLYLNWDEKFFQFEALGGKFLIPLIIRPLGQGSKDAISSYGYSGIYASPELTKQEKLQAWGEFLRVLKEENIVSVFFRQNNLEEQILSNQYVFPELSVVEVSTTYMVPLLADESIMWNLMEGRSRTSIRKAENACLEFKIEPFSLDSSKSFSNFKNLYFETMKRRNANEFYMFEDDYFYSLSQLNTPKTFVATVQENTGRSLSSCLVLAEDQMLHYHLSGSSNDAGKIGANNMLIWGIQKWGASLGYTHFHLGGGLTKGDSLSKFKKQFGSKEIPFFVGKLISDPAKYSLLTRQRAEQIGVSHEYLENSNFFPAYRSSNQGI